MSQKIGLHKDLSKYNKSSESVIFCCTDHVQGSTLCERGESRWWEGHKGHWGL